MMTDQNIVKKKKTGKCYFSLLLASVVGTENKEIDKHDSVPVLHTLL